MTTPILTPELRSHPLVDRRSRRRKGLPREIAYELSDLVIDLRSASSAAPVREHVPTDADDGYGAILLDGERIEPTAAVVCSTPLLFSRAVLVVNEADSSVAVETVTDLSGRSARDEFDVDQHVSGFLAAKTSKTAVPPGWSVNTPRSARSRFGLRRRQRAAWARIRSFTRSLTPSEWRRHRRHRKENHRFASPLY